MFEGFYKVRFQLNAAVGRSVMYARDGKMLGGNSAFAHIGTYRKKPTTGSTSRSRPSVIIRIRITARWPAPTTRRCWRRAGRTAISTALKAGLKELPGAVFHSVMTPIEEEAIPIAGGVGEGGIVNGLYSIHIRMLDGVDGGLTGVMLLNDGRILGGDASFYYLGTYTSENGRWKGQILNQEHTPARGENPVFGGHEVGIGFSGTCDEEGALLEATALAGKRSLRMTAVLKLMRRAVADEQYRTRALDAGAEGRGPQPRRTVSRRPAACVSTPISRRRWRCWSACAAARRPMSSS